MPSGRFSITLTGVSTTSGFMTPYIPDTMIRPFNIGIGCVTASSSTVYTVQHSFDYTGSSTFISSNATWFPNSGLTGKSCNTDGNYAFPVSAIRCISTAGASDNTITLTIIQAG